MNYMPVNKNNDTILSDTINNNNNNNNTDDILKIIMELKEDIKKLENRIFQMEKNNNIIIENENIKYSIEEKTI